MTEIKSIMLSNDLKSLRIQQDFRPKPYEKPDSLLY